MIQVQFLLHGLNNGSNDETKTINDGVLVYFIQKFIRTAIFRCKCSEEYRQVEIDADLEKSSIKYSRQKRRKRARRRGLTPIPAISGFDSIHLSAIV